MNPIESAVRNLVKKIVSSKIVSELRLYQAWYRIEPTFNESDVPKSLGELMSKYVKVAEIPAVSLGQVYTLMQGEQWSADGQARDYIRRLGLHHTSMSVGDLIRDDTGTFSVVAGIGFDQIALTYGEQTPKTEVV